MKETVWERFDIDPRHLEGAAVVGVDNGAGNCCAALSQMNLGEWLGGHLYFDDLHNIDNMYTVCTGSGSKTWVGMEAVRKENSNVFVNFKMPPDDEVSEQCYGGGLKNPSYREIMQRFFQTMIGELFRCNPDKLKSKHVILFVGRPASPRWQRCEREYQKLLGEGLQEQLKKAGFEGTVDIVVYSEAQAALAYEYSKKQIQGNECVLIIDCGSSTFDAVLVKDCRIITEYSRQLGAGMIEKLMFDMVLCKEDMNILRSVDNREAMHANLCTKLVGATREGPVEIALRQKKELFFGPDGTANDPQVQMLDLAGQGKITSLIDENFMHKVIHDIPVRVLDSQLDKNGLARFGTTDYPSFYAATKAFMEGVKAACGAAGAMPDRVILTGGASVMPFIKELIAKVFNKKSALSKSGIPFIRELGQILSKDKDVLSGISNPAFSVGEGLAFMGYVELQKHGALTALRDKIIELTSSYSTQAQVRDTIQNHFVDAVWENIVKDLDTWSTSDQLGTTLRSAIDDRTFYVDYEHICRNIQNSFASADGLYSTIQDIINQHFESLFPRKPEFSFKIETDFLINIVVHTQGLKRVLIYKDDLLGSFRGFFTSWDKPLSREKRRDIYYRVINRRDENRAALKAHLSSSAWDAAGKLLTEIQPKIMEELTTFMEEKVTPYFVEDLQG